MILVAVVYRPFAPSQHPSQLMNVSYNNSICSIVEWACLDTQPAAGKAWCKQICRPWPWRWAHFIATPRDSFWCLSSFLRPFALQTVPAACSAKSDAECETNPALGEGDSQLRASQVPMNMAERDVRLDEACARISDLESQLIPRDARAEEQQKVRASMSLTQAFANIKPCW